MKSKYEMLIFDWEKPAGLVRAPGKPTVYLGHIHVSALIDRL